MVNINQYNSILECINKDKGAINVVFNDNRQIDDIDGAYIGWHHFNNSVFKNYEVVNLIFALNNDYHLLKKYIQKFMAYQNHIDKISISIVGNDSDYLKDFTGALKGSLIKNKRRQVEFLYDTTCELLDEKFSKCNYCDFKNDQCKANRNKDIKYENCGCCHSFEIANFFSFSYFNNEQICKHLVNKTCDTKNISCKLFTCSILKKENVKFSPNKILMLDLFFTRKQKDILTLNFFKTREEILEKLMVNNKLPYLFFLLRRRYKIK